MSIVIRNFIPGILFSDCYSVFRRAAGGKIWNRLFCIILPPRCQYCGKDTLTESILFGVSPEAGKEVYAMYYRKVEICGVNTSRLPTLTDAEKRDLMKKARAGDAGARQRLIDGNLRLVLSIVGRYAGTRGEHPDDLFQVGCVGLIKAVDHFDLTQDVKFSTYAVPMIVGEVRRYLRDNTPIRVSRSVRDLAYRALNAKELLSKRLPGEPTPEEITAFLNAEAAKRAESESDQPSPRPVTAEEVSEALDAIIDPVSLSEPIAGDSGDTLSVMDVISDKENGEENWIESIALKEALKTLNEREKRIVYLRFFRGRTQTEIASEIGISQAQVSRLEKAALERLRKNME